MAQVELAPEELEQACAAYGARLSIAAVNGPASTVISGEVESVAELSARLEARGASVRALPVNYAFHSAQMAPMQAELEVALGGLAAHPAHLPWISTVTGAPQAEAPSAAYWGRNVRQTVRFAAAVEALLEHGIDVCVEIGPHPVLGASIIATAAALERRVATLPSLRRGRPEREMLLQAAAELWVRGADLRWSSIEPLAGGRSVVLPTYPWQRQRYWFTPGAGLASQPVSRLGSDAANPPGRPWRSPALAGTVFELELSPQTPAFLADHRVYGTPLLPATAILELMRAAGEAAFGPGSREVSDVNLSASIPLAADRSTRVHVHVTSTGEVRLDSTPSDAESWQLHATARLVEAIGPIRVPETVAEVRARCPDQQVAAEHYAQLAARGLVYGPTFRSIERVWRRAGEALGSLDVTSAAAWGAAVAPGLLDGVLQVASAALPSNAKDDEHHTWLPVGLEHYWIESGKVPSELWSHARVRDWAEDVSTGPSVVTVDVQAIGPHGELWAEFRGLRVKRTERAAVEALWTPRAVPDLAQTIRWVPLNARAEADESGRGQARSDASGGRHWLVLADQGGLGAALVAALLDTGDAATVVPGDRLDDAAADPDAALERLRADLARRLAEAPVDEVVYLWGLDTPPAEMTTGGLTAAQVHGLGGALVVAQVLAELPGPAPRLTLVTRGAQPVSGVERVAVEQAPLWGFGTTLQLEHPAVQPTLIDLDPFAAATPAAEASMLLGELRAGRLEARRGLRAGSVFVPRLTPLTSDTRDFGPLASDDAVRVRVAARGALDQLRLEPLVPQAPRSGEVQVSVQAAGLNFRDVLNALGQYPGEPGELGDECAGIVTAVGHGVSDLHVGDRVMGLAAGSLATSVTTPAALLARIPPRLSFAAAATVPIAFLTAHYALSRVGGLRTGQRVLVHAAAGGVGLAAVQLAQRAGAEVFATAGSPAKRAFLRRLGVRHVFDSRSLSFADGVRAATVGAGVDVVLNSLAGAFIPASLDLVRDGGHFLEIGKLGTWSAAEVAARRPEIEYSVIFLGDLLNNAPALVQELLEELARWLEAGELQPLPQRTFALSEVVEAFRYMAQARQIGKIVLVPGRAQAASAIRPDATYLITGGTGAIGQHLARWLAARGARSLVLVSRTGDSPAASALRADLEAQGARVLIAATDISRPGAVEALLERLRNEAWPPLGGVIHAAGINDDGVLAQQRWSRFSGVLGTKLDAAWQLHVATRDQLLDFFVLCSSAAGVIGSAAQSNYAAANCSLDALAQYRRALGLPALSLDWGAWENTGMTARLGIQERSRWARRGLVAMSPTDALSALELAFGQPWPQVVVCGLDPARVPHTDPLHALAADLDAAGSVRAAPMAPSGPTFLEQWAVTPVSRRRALLVDHLQHEVARVLGLPSAQPIAPRQALNDLGLDSLTAVELRNALGAALETTLPATLLFDYPTPEALVDFLLATVPALRAPKPTPSLADAPSESSPRCADEPADLSNLDELSDAEAEALLVAELELIRGRR
jgi:NADPH:quinone reductase-like Zn-dependent oxidoreductase/acyl carrier protein